MRFLFSHIILYFSEIESSILFGLLAIVSYGQKRVVVDSTFIIKQNIQKVYQGTYNNEKPYDG